jgi:WD40 repeat protein
VKHLVITVHGIRTFGGWQERLEKLLKDQVNPEDLGCLEINNYKFGWFSVIGFLIPFSRWLVVRRFRSELLRCANKTKWDRIDLVGHSFGTHLIGWGLYSMKPDERPQVHTIVFAGSVLKPSFPWLDLFGSCLYRLVNDCGIHDRVLVLNQIVVLFTGMAGRVGFAGMTGDTFQNRYFPFGHSGYFENSAGPDDIFMKEKWVTLLMQDAAIASFPDPRTASAVSGVIASILNNLEPIKLAIYVTPLVALFLFYRGLYIGERTARENAIAKKQIAKRNKKESNRQREIAEKNQKLAEAKQKEADQERDRSLEALANTHLREGLNRLTKPETSAEGLAHLAQAVRVGHLRPAETRLWTIFQQRQFWLSTSGSEPAPAPSVPDQKMIDPRFASVVYNRKRLRPALFARSADGRVCATVVNGEDLSETELHHFRVWHSGGTPITPWLTVGDAWANDVRALSGVYLSPDGKFVAVVAFAWRNPEYLEVWNTTTRKRVGQAIEATGRSPMHQNVVFTKVSFLYRPSADTDQRNLMLLTGSQRGDTSLFEVTDDTFELLGRCSHATDVTAAEVDEHGRWLMSASSDHEVRVLDLKEEKPVGHPFLASLAVQNLQRSAPDRIRLRFDEKSGAEYQLSSLIAVPPSGALLQPAEFDWQKDVNEAGPNVAPLPSPGSILARSADDRWAVRAISAGEIAVVDAPKDGNEREIWRHSFASPVLGARFRPDNVKLIVQTFNFVTEIWDPSTNRRVGTPIDETRLFAEKEIPLRPLPSMLGSRGDVLLTRSFFSEPAGADNYWFTVWDIATGLPLIDRVHADEGMDETPINHAELSDDQQMLLFGDNYHPETATRCLQIGVPASIKDLLVDAAEGLGGLKLDQDGSFSPVDNRAEKVNVLITRLHAPQPSPNSGH